jgi:hypothetical protein
MDPMDTSDPYLVITKKMDPMIDTLDPYLVITKKMDPMDTLNPYLVITKKNGSDGYNGSIFSYNKKKWIRWIHWIHT